MRMPDDLLPEYQEAIKKLTAENRELARTITTERQAHREETRKLAGQLNEGLTPEVLMLRREVKKWRSRALAAEARLSEAKRSTR